MKLVRRQSARSQRRYQRTRTWHWFHPKTGGDRRSDNALAWIADPRAARIRHQRNLIAAAQALDDLFAAPCFVKLKITQQRFGNAKVLEQLASSPRVLRCHKIALLQGA